MSLFDVLVAVITVVAYLAVIKKKENFQNVCQWYVFEKNVSWICVENTN